MSLRFTKFKVYQDSKVLHSKVVIITRKFPKDFYYLKDQLRRCTLSIVLNIAEGSAKTSDKDFNRYIENSLGSANEAASALDVSLSEELISKREFDDLIDRAEQVINQLGGFSKKLKVGG